MKEEDVLKQAKEIEEELKGVGQEVKKFKSPLWYILGVLLALLIVLMIVPYYSIRLDPRPSYTPTLEEVLPASIDVNETYLNAISMEMVNGRDPVIKEIADKIVVKACEKEGRVCHAKAIFYFVRDNFEYVSDPTAYEYVKTAKESLVSGGGDCDDSSVLAASLLDAIGVKSRFVFIPGHVFIQANLPEALNRYKVDNGWVNLDAACSYCEFGEISWKSVDKEKKYLG